MNNFIVIRETETNIELNKKNTSLSTRKAIFFIEKVYFLAISISIIVYNTHLFFILKQSLKNLLVLFSSHAFNASVTTKLFRIIFFCLGNN